MVYNYPYPHKVFKTMLNAHSMITQAGFRTDALSPAFDWLILKECRFDWPRAPSR